MIKLQAKSFMIHHDEKLPVVRQLGTTWVDGKPVHYQEMGFTIICNVQPMNAKDLLLVPEGDRHKEQYFVWTDNSDAINPKLEPTDKITRLGIVFQIQSVENWGSYSRARMMKIDVQKEEQTQGT